jgi:hypothetical protein
MKNSILSALFFLVAAFIAGCTNSPISSSGNGGTLRIGIKANSGTAPIQAMSPSFGLNDINRITISSAKVVLKEMEFESESAGGALSFEKPFPYIWTLDSDTAVQFINIAYVPDILGYDDVEFDIGRLTAKCGELFRNNPTMQEKSIVIEGCIDGDPLKPFQYSIAMDTDLEIDLSEHLIQNADNTFTFIIVLNINAWFVDINGMLLDPRTPENSVKIEQNIKKSIHAFDD